MADVALVVGGDALEAADGDRLFLHAAAAAGGFAGAITGAAKNAWEDVGLPVDHEGVGIAAGGDQPDIFRHGRMGGARPLAIDHFVEVVGVADISRLQVGLLSLGAGTRRYMAFPTAVSLCGRGPCASITLARMEGWFNGMGVGDWGCPNGICRAMMPLTTSQLVMRNMPGEGYIAVITGLSIWLKLVSA